jgi:hypothetical protein
MLILVRADKVRRQAVTRHGAAQSRLATHKRPPVTATHHATRHRQESTLLGHSASHSERLFLPDTVEKPLFGGGRATFSHYIKNNALIISKGYCTSPFRKVAHYGLKNRVHRVFQQYRPKPAIRIPRCWHILIALQDALREPLREASSAGFLIPRLTRANAVLGRS